MTGDRRICRWSLDAAPALPNEAGAPGRAEIDAYALLVAGAPTAGGWAAAELQRRWDAAGTALLVLWPRPARSPTASPTASASCSPP